MLKQSLLLTVLSFGLIATAQAAPMYQSKDTCYTFNQKTDKLIAKGSCEVNSGYGAGGSYLNIKFKNKTYYFEYSNVYNDKGEMEVLKYITKNGKEVLVDEEYIRNAKTLKKVKSEQESARLDTNQMLFCEKAKNVDICYKSAQ